MAAEEYTLSPKVTQKMIGMDQPEPPQHAQECKILGNKGRQQEGQHDDQIREGIDARKFLAQVFGDPEPGREIQKDEQAEPGVERCHDRCGG